MLAKLAANRIELIADSLWISYPFYYELRANILFGFSSFFEEGGHGEC